MTILQLQLGSGFLRIEWDESKNASNLAKHGIRFEEAAYAFGDPGQIIAKDRVDEKGEQRWHLIGVIPSSLLILVVHTIRVAEDDQETIRIISARDVTRRERRTYENENGLLHS